MKTLLASLLMITCCFAQDDPAHNQLRETRAAIIAAIEKRDADTILSMLSDDVVVTWQDGTVCHGKKALREYYDKAGKDAFVAFKVPHEADQLSVLHGGDTAVAAGRVVADYRLLGKSFEFESRWTATLVRQDDKWLVAAYHVSLNALDNPILNTAKTAMWVAGAVGLLAGLAIALLIAKTRCKSKATA